MKSLFEGTILGSMAMGNRFVRAAVGEKTDDGAVNAQMLGLYRELSRGGAGTLITGLTLVSQTERTYPILALSEDSLLDGHRELTALVHGEGANIISQLVHVGSFALHGRRAERLLAPSAVTHLKSGQTPKEASEDELGTIRREFAQAALRAKEAGYDGVEIHGAHWFFLSQFMSPHYNRRTDRYGGPVENRARMLLETYGAIREAVGPGFQVWAKINVTDGFEGGVTLDDCLYLGRELSRLGLDAIEISGDWMAHGEDGGPFFKTEATAMAAASRAAIILTGGNRDPRTMSVILNETGIAYFGLARPLIRDPGLINSLKGKMDL
ncbi:MAG: NADH:flavin oxidoreductase [Deltaproteobacteria bacterium]|jgi:2,4-dienoyl-CoA reductase-like NADH-dependent reductase (Old Yellow Enzyme family)|nr:NADH:flavin oxidoreductase [Deltaproteobacteria bacterium]